MVLAVCAAMRSAVLILPLMACASSPIWQPTMYVDPSPKPLHVGASQRFEVLQEAYDNSFDLTGDGDGYFPGVPINWSVSVHLGAAAIAVQKVPDVDASFIVDALALGDASLDLIGESGATLAVDLNVVP